jgi:MYXO-CTERM domain-containing protein
VLDRDLDGEISPVRLSGEVSRTESVRVVGYGETEVYGATISRLARAGVRVTDVGPLTDAEPTGTTPPRTFVVSEGPCHGDSGGPALSEETGALMGVYSIAAGPSCTGAGIRNIYTSLVPFSGLAYQAFEAAGAEPLLEETEPEPERPPVVAEQGCSIPPSPRPASPASTALLTALALGALWRSRRRY